MPTSSTTRAALVVEGFDSNYNNLGFALGPLSFQVTAGQTYYLGVTTYQNRNFNPTNTFTRLAGSTSTPTPFDLTVAFDNGDSNGTIEQATTSAVGTPITSQVGGSESNGPIGANGGNKDADFYSYVMPSSGVFHATVSGAGGFTPAMTLWSSTDGIFGVQRLADAPTTGTMQLYQQVTAGQVVVVSVTGLGNQNLNGISEGSGAGGQLGTYTLTSAVDPSSELTTLSNNSIQNATLTPLTLNTPVAANIGRMEISTSVRTTSICIRSSPPRPRSTVRHRHQPGRRPKLSCASSIRRATRSQSTRRAARQHEQRLARAVTARRDGICRHQRRWAAGIHV